MTYLSVFFPAAVSAQALPAWQVCVFLLWCTVPPAAVLLAAFTDTEFSFPSSTSVEPLPDYCRQDVYADAADYFFPVRSGAKEDPPAPPAPLHSKLPFAIAAQALDFIGCFIPLFGFLPGGIAFYLGRLYSENDECYAYARHAVLFGAAAVLQSVFLIWALGRMYP